MMQTKKKKLLQNYEFTLTKIAVFIAVRTTTTFAVIDKKKNNKKNRFVSSQVCVCCDQKYSSENGTHCERMLNNAVAAIKNAHTHTHTHQYH